jgi:hypothetical protein
VRRDEPRRHGGHGVGKSGEKQNFLSCLHILSVSSVPQWFNYRMYVRVFGRVLTWAVGNVTMCTYTGGDAAERRGALECSPWGVSNEPRLWADRLRPGTLRGLYPYCSINQSCGTRGSAARTQGDDNAIGTPSGYMVDPPLMLQSRGRAVMAEQLGQKAAMSSSIRSPFDPSGNARGTATLLPPLLSASGWSRGLGQTLLTGASNE